MGWLSLLGAIALVVLGPPRRGNVVSGPTRPSRGIDAEPMNLHVATHGLDQGDVEKMMANRLAALADNNPPAVFALDDHALASGCLERPEGPGFHATSLRHK
jgi:hypothetical protein